MKTPSTDEITAGVDHQITDDFAVSATFSYRNTSNLQSPILIGATAADYAFAGRATGVAIADDGFTLRFDEPYYSLQIPPPSGFELVNRPGATQRYFGLDLSLVKQFSHDWTVRANVGWNSFRQYLTPESILNPNNLWGEGGQNVDGGIAAGVSNKLNVWLNADWQFNLSALYQGPWGIRLGANLFGRQGYPNPDQLFVSLGDVNDQTVDLLVDEMDTYRYPNVYQLDLRLEKSFEIGPVTITPAAELFNVANSNTVIDSVPVVGTYYADTGVLDKYPSFNQIVEVQSPRIVRLSIQIAF